MENKRLEAENKLDFFLDNPGYFSILLLGENGTGKTFMLNRLFEKRKIEQPNIKFFYPIEIGETLCEIANIFGNDYIVIKNVEALSERQQSILNIALSTSDGTIGLEDKRGFKRIIFTSTYEVHQLTEGQNRLNITFWDRISQLVVKVPSFKDYNAGFRNDFKDVWEKMKFNDFNKMPEDGDFIAWLRDESSSFSGNFRDYDKIAILWHQYRLIEYNDSKQKFKADIEQRIYRKVKQDFKLISHFPTQKADTTNTFEITKGKPWKDIEKEFQAMFKAWAKANYNSIKEATKELKMPLRKMDKW
jgi:hypothetical protein